MDSRLKVSGMTTLERNPALGAAESLAKSHSLANLFERSELFAPIIWPGMKGPQGGRGRAEVVLGPFAETKGPRLPGRPPASQKTDQAQKIVNNPHMPYYSDLQF